MVLLLLFLFCYLISVHRNLDDASSKFPEGFSLHDGVIVFGSLDGGRDKVGGKDVCILGNSSCGLSVVTRNHSDSDACLLAVEDSFRDGFLERVFDASNADDDQVLFQSFGVVCFGV